MRLRKACPENPPTLVVGSVNTKERLMAWAGNPERKFICIFCGSPPAEHNGFMWCRRCKEYKGIMPDCPK